MKSAPSVSNAKLFVVSAELEAEIADFPDDEKLLFLQDLGIEETALYKLIQASYRTLGLMSFLTSGEDETRAWTIRIGTKAFLSTCLPCRACRTMSWLSASKIFA